MMSKRKSNGAKVYGSYVFKDKDPAIDELRTLIETHYNKRIHSKQLSQIAADGGPTVGCMRAWFFGDTLRPQNPTLEAAGRALGYKRIWRKM
jgi:hypothetical protein